MYVDPDGEVPILEVPLLMHAARIVATAAIRRAAPVAARFVARAATRSAAATARNVRFVGQATANFGRSSAIQANTVDYTHNAFQRTENDWTMLPVPSTVSVAFECAS